MQAFCRRRGSGERGAGSTSEGLPFRAGSSDAVQASAGRSWMVGDSMPTGRCAGGLTAPSGLSSCFGSVATPTAAPATHTINTMLNQRGAAPDFACRVSTRLIATGRSNSNLLAGRECSCAARSESRFFKATLTAREKKRAIMFLNFARNENVAKRNVSALPRQKSGPGPAFSPAIAFSLAEDSFAVIRPMSTLAVKIRRSGADFPRTARTNVPGAGRSQHGHAVALSRVRSANRPKPPTRDRLTHTR